MNSKSEIKTEGSDKKEILQLRPTDFKIEIRSYIKKGSPDYANTDIKLSKGSVFTNGNLCADDCMELSKYFSNLSKKIKLFSKAQK